MAHDADASAILAETVHTAFRKGCSRGGDVWHAIGEMPPDEWAKAIEYMLWSLDAMDFELIRKSQKQAASAA